MELSSSPGSSKKVKAFGSMAHVVSCLVDGCNSDLSRCRNYHRRHKVCEIHSKTPKVTIRGQEQRFCQQCSRFHSLIEFDEEKRSCRKRLDGHNRRRRKPQADSLHRTSDIFHSNHPGSRLLSFSNPQILLTATENCTWTKNIKTEDDILPSNLNYTNSHNLFTRSSAQNYKARPQFSQITDNIPPVTSFGQQFPEPHSTHCISQKEFSHHLTLAGNSNGAYSLLSSESTETSEAGSSHMVRPNHGSSRMVRPNHFPLSQSLLQNLHFSGLDRYHFTRFETKPIVSELSPYSPVND